MFDNQASFDNRETNNNRRNPVNNLKAPLNLPNGTVKINRKKVSGNIINDLFKLKSPNASLLLDD